MTGLHRVCRKWNKRSRQTVHPTLLLYKKFKELDVQINTDAGLWHGKFLRCWLKSSCCFWALLSWDGQPVMTVIRNEYWGRKCPFICFYCWEPQSFHEAAALFIKFDIQYSMSAARLSEMFSIFVVLSSQHTYWWKCFRTVLDKKCGSFYEERTDGQHSFIPFRLCQTESAPHFLFY